MFEKLYRYIMLGLQNRQVELRFDDLDQALRRARGEVGAVIIDLANGGKVYDEEYGVEESLEEYCQRFPHFDRFLPDVLTEEKRFQCLNLRPNLDRFKVWEEAIELGFLTISEALNIAVLYGEMVG